MSRATITIVDDYPPPLGPPGPPGPLGPPELSLTVPNVQEGDSGFVTVELSYDLPWAVAVSLRVVGGTADLSDYSLTPRHQGVLSILERRRPDSI